MLEELVLDAGFSACREELVTLSETEPPDKITNLEGLATWVSSTWPSLRQKRAEAAKASQKPGDTCSTALMTREEGIQVPILKRSTRSGWREKSCTSKTC